MKHKHPKLGGADCKGKLPGVQGGSKSSQDQWDVSHPTACPGSKSCPQFCPRDSAGSSPGVGDTPCCAFPAPQEVVNKVYGEVPSVGSQSAGGTPPFSKCLIGGWERLDPTPAPDRIRLCVWITTLGWPERPGLNRRPARSTKHSRFRASLTRGASSLLHAPTQSCTSPAAHAEPARLSRHTGLRDAPRHHSHMHPATNSQTMEFGRGESPSWTQNPRLSPELHLPHAAMGQIPSRAPLSSSWVRVWHGDSIPQSGKAPLPEGSGASRASE